MLMLEIQYIKDPFYISSNSFNLELQEMAEFRIVYRFVPIQKMENINKLLKEYSGTGDLKVAINILTTCIKTNLHKTGCELGSLFIKLFKSNELRLIYSELLINTKRYMEAYLILNTVWDSSNNSNIIDSVKKLQLLCIPHIKHNYTNYNGTFIIPSAFTFITLTITSCKRLDLFEKTLNSFINCCLDIHLINRWFCVDDNSSSEDREKMQTLYPFIEFYFKTPEEKGHAKSMNIIKRNVLSPYIFHLEDDWQFFSKRNYITECMDVLNTSDTYGQCLINYNGIEVETQNITGGEILRTEDGTKYRLHQYASSEEEQNMYFEKNGLDHNIYYWPHFSLRPSLIKTRVLHTVGDFSEHGAHFEQEYAGRYVNNGYKSTFLDNIYCVHIGRLTSERHDNTKLNAYILNEVPQFDIIIPERIKTLKSFVINMDRRVDRYEKFQKEFQSRVLNPIRFSAIDGKSLKPNFKLNKIFEGNDYNMRAGIAGCALSHISLWISLLNSNDEEYCVLEDDIKGKDFDNDFINIYQAIEKETYDILFLSYHLRNPNTNNALVLSKKNFKESLDFSLGGTGGYLITKKGAKKILEYIEKYSMTNAIDTVIQKASDDLSVYYCNPPIFETECYDHNNEIDTDIQKEFTSLTANVKDLIKEETVYYSDKGGLQEEKDSNLIINGFFKEGAVLYRGDNIDIIKGKSPYVSYSLDSNTQIFVITINSKIYEDKFQRLYRDEKFSIDSSVTFEKQIKTYISLGDNTKVSRALKNTGTYFFDTIEGLTPSVILYMLQSILEGNIESFVKELTDTNKNKLVLIPYKQKNMISNTKFKLNFPHEDIEGIEEEYIKRANRMKDAILSGNPITFVHGTYWDFRPAMIFYNIYNLLSKYNKNIKIITINGVNEEIDKKYENIISKTIPFPEEYKNNQWSFEKTKYDNEVFYSQLNRYLATIIN